MTAWFADFNKVLHRSISNLHFGDALISETGQYKVYCMPDDNNIKKIYIIIVNGVIKARRKRIESVITNLLQDYELNEHMTYVSQGAIPEARRLFSDTESEYLNYMPIVHFTTKDSSAYSVVAVLKPFNKIKVFIRTVDFFINSFKFFVKETHTKWIQRKLDKRQN